MDAQVRRTWTEEVRSSMHSPADLSDSEQWFQARVCGLAPETVSESHLLTMALSLAHPHADIPALAEKLLAAFGSYAEAISADPQRLAEAGLSERAILA